MAMVKKLRLPILLPLCFPRTKKRRRKEKMLKPNRSGGEGGGADIANANSKRFSICYVWKKWLCRWKKWLCQPAHQTQIIIQSQHTKSHTHDHVADVEMNKSALLNLPLNKDPILAKSESIQKLVCIARASDTSLAMQEATMALLGSIEAREELMMRQGSVQLLVNMFQNGRTVSCRKYAARALYNLAICATNLKAMLETQLVDALVDAIDDTQVCKKALELLGRLVEVPEGREQVIRKKDGVLKVLEVLGWSDEPKCQEKAAFVLMLMLQNDWDLRQALSRAGAVSVLLELVLLGSEIAQNRASTILQWLREDRHHSASPAQPHRHAPVLVHPHDYQASHQRQLVSKMVQESLLLNMERITRRARLPSLDLSRSSSGSSFVF